MSKFTECVGQTSTSRATSCMMQMRKYYIYQTFLDSLIQNYFVEFKVVSVFQVTI